MIRTVGIKRRPQSGRALVVNKVLEAELAGSQSVHTATHSLDMKSSFYFHSTCNCVDS